MSFSYSIRYIHSEALTRVLIVHFFLYVDTWGVFIAGDGNSWHAQSGKEQSFVVFFFLKKKDITA